MKQFVTRDVRQGLPAYIINILWYMLEKMEASDLCTIQSFFLSEINIDGKLYQQILQTQESPRYKRSFSFECQNPVNEFVTIERFDNYWIMYFSDV